MKLSVANIMISVLFLRFAFLFRKHESNIKLFVKGVDTNQSNHSNQ